MPPTPLIAWLTSILRVSIGIATMFAAACSEPLACNYPGRPAVKVQVRDAITTLPAAYQARLIMQSRTGTDTFPDFTAPADSGLQTEMWGIGGAGTYTVIVEKEGYLPWVRSNVVVRQIDDCGAIQSVSLFANLTPVR